GSLLRETAGGSWQDLSRSQYPGTGAALPGDGAIKTDPILAIATSPDGSRVWAVGGYAGGAAAAGHGASNILPARSRDWYPSSIWRRDESGFAAPLGLQARTISLPGQGRTVSFAFFSGSQCNVQCAATLHSQPDVNLSAAVREIVQLAQ